ncbi:MAG: ATP-dependent DNA helicase RecG [Candidatus Berkelbacteria bacterium]|nr:ATP-dependent DNA helicase RecG [Candidatus Berkelbacteria bacterium]
MKNINVSDSILKIPFVGPKQAEAFARLNIKTVEDLLSNLPRDIVDLTKTIEIQNLRLKINAKVAILAKVKSTSILKTPKRRMWIVNALLSDKSGSVEAIWFNQPYMRETLKQGSEFIFFGTVSFNQTGRKIILNNPEIFPKSQIYPIYAQTEGLTSKQILRVVKSALETGYKIEEFLDDNILQKYSLLNMQAATKSLHFPTTKENFQKAKERFIFNNLLNLILANLFLKNKNKNEKSYKIKVDQKFVENFVKSLPFKLTKDQNKVVAEILSDFQKPSPMNRLVQGDVGSGKTIVALIASLVAIQNNYQVAWMAPTEILANQHFETINKFLKLIKSKIKVGLITSATKKKSQPDGRPLAETAGLLIGTHALIQKDVKFKALALVIVDEQHRFGVNQRDELLQSTAATNQKIIPHFLSLSATPIPRSLAHVIFGNCDLSIIETKPIGRKQVKTYLIPEPKRNDAYRFIDERIKVGEQAFIICPLIENNQDEQNLIQESVKAVTKEINNLQKTALAKRKISMIHGKLKSKEKEEIMAKMQNKKIDVLVSTSVVEVGVDVKDATIMMIEDAENFGLSQLHQFRGRVGRSDLQSYCFLFCRNLENEKTKARLKAFVRSFDGFKLAEMDLKQRGPGALFSFEQSGFKGINPFWFENSKVLAASSLAANELIDDLDHNDFLKTKVLKLLETDHTE